ncbi:MAG TPA: hypothetical protein VK507_19180 [Iamia sp.]|nr:hypothetical protein [Iamia sp.]
MLLSEIVIGDEYTVFDVAVECQPPRWRAAEIVRRQSSSGRLVRHVLVDELDYETGAIVPRSAEMVPGVFSRTGQFMVPAELAPYDSAREAHEKWKTSSAEAEAAADRVDAGLSDAGIGGFRVVDAVTPQGNGKVTIVLDVPNAVRLAHALGIDVSDQHHRVAALRTARGES